MINESSNKIKILVFGFIDMNAMDGSAVFLSSFANTLSLDKNIEVDLLLARPIIRDILVKPLHNIENINIINPFEDPYFKNQNLDWVKKGFLNYELVEELIVHYWNKNNYDWLFVRSIETVEKLLNHKEIISNTMAYITGLVDSDQKLPKEKVNLFKELYKKTAMFFCQTNEMKESIIKLLDLNRKINKVNVLNPMVPDVDLKLLGQSSKQINNVVYTGKFDKDWRSIEIISAFKELKREYVNLKLEVAGDKFNKDLSNPFFKEELIYLLKNTEGVLWHGAVPRSKAQEIITNSDIGITWRSENMDNSLELSTKLLEYGTYRKAVIMNPTEMHKKLFGEDYPLYAVSEKDFRNVIEMCITNPEIYDFAANRMQEVSMKFTFSESIKKIQPIIWENKLINYIDNEKMDIFIDNFTELRIKSEYLKFLPKNIQTLKDDEIKLLVNLSEEKKKFITLHKISSYGKIVSIKKIGCYDILNMKKIPNNIEGNLETNIEFLKEIGTNIKLTPKLLDKVNQSTNQNNNFETNNRKELINLEQQFNELKNELIIIKKKHETLEHKYKSLSKSKLGKLTLKYWKWRKKRVNKKVLIN